ACVLSKEQRRAVENQVAETCIHRGWNLEVVNCRSNHVHVVLIAEVDDPKRIRIALKAWATRALKEQFGGSRENWWAERGSIRYLNNEDELERATVYARDGQGSERFANK